MFALDTRDRALFPSRGLRVMLKSEWADPAIGSGAHFSSNVLDISGAWPVGRNVSLLGRVIAGNAAGDDLPDYYLFYLGGSQPYYLFPDRQFEFAGLRTAQRFGRAVQTVVAGVQVEVRPDVFARLRWNAGSTLPEWTGLDLDDWTTGGDLTGALRTRFGTFSLTLATERFTDFLVSIDAGYAF
jgi:NTE family protein